MLADRAALWNGLLLCGVRALKQDSLGSFNPLTSLSVRNVTEEVHKNVFVVSFHDGNFAGCTVATFQFDAETLKDVVDLGLLALDLSTGVAGLMLRFDLAVRWVRLKQLHLF